MRPRNMAAALCALVCACGPDNPEHQSLGKTSGIFSRFYPSDPFCELSGDQALTLTVLFPFHPDTGMTDKDVLFLQLQPLASADTRFQFSTGLQYGIGQSASAVVDIERGRERVSPNLSGEVAKQAQAQRLNLVFPLWLHKVRVSGAKLCNGMALGAELDLTDCLDVPDSTIDEAKLWCAVGVQVAPEWSQ